LRILIADEDGTAREALRAAAGEPASARSLALRTRDAGDRIRNIVERMTTAHRYVTTPYLRNTEIVDFCEAADTPAGADAKRSVT
jgi:hypothetical protein